MALSKQDGDQELVAKGTIPVAKYTQPRGGDEKRFFFKHIVKKDKLIANNQKNKPLGVAGGEEVFDVKTTKDKTVRANLTAPENADQLAYEAVEPIKEVSMNLLKRYSAGADASIKNATKNVTYDSTHDDFTAEEKSAIRKRGNGSKLILKKAIKGKAPFNEEELNELNPETIRDYSTAALQSKHNVVRKYRAFPDAVNGTGADPYKDMADDDKKTVKKRNVGIQLVVKRALAGKLTPLAAKEETDINKYVDSTDPIFEGMSKKDRIRFALLEAFGGGGDAPVGSDSPAESNGQAPKDDGDEVQPDDKKDSNDGDDQGNPVMKQLEQLALTTAQLYELLMTDKGELDQEEQQEVAAAFDAIDAIYNDRVNGDENDEDDGDGDDDDTETKPDTSNTKDTSFAKESLDEAQNSKGHETPNTHVDEKLHGYLKSNGFKHSNFENGAHMYDSIHQSHGTTNHTYLKGKEGVLVIAHPKDHYGQHEITHYSMHNTDSGDIMKKGLHRSAYYPHSEHGMSVGLVNQKHVDFLNKKPIKEEAFSAKAGSEGKDLGKPGKNFSKIADSASKKYGSKEAGEKVAGAILGKIRANHFHKEAFYNRSTGRWGLTNKATSGRPSAPADPALQKAFDDHLNAVDKMFEPKKNRFSRKKDDK